MLDVPKYSRSPDPHHFPARFLDRIIRNSERADRIISQMEPLSREDTHHVQQVDVNELVLSTAQMDCHSAAAGHPDLSVRINPELDPEAGEMPAIAEDMARVITNVVANTCQAMAERAKTVEEYSPELTLRTRRKNGEVTIVIVDNSTGINPQITDRIFNPSFTTQAANQGTGLGLSTCQDIVQAHGGRMPVKSGPGEYTEMAISLPGRGQRRKKPGSDRNGKDGPQNEETGRDPPPHHPGGTDGPLGEDSGTRCHRPKAVACLGRNPNNEGTPSSGTCCYGCPGDC